MVRPCLNGLTFNPAPPLNGPAVSGGTFFAASSEALRISKSANSYFLIKLVAMTFGAKKIPESAKMPLIPEFFFNPPCNN